MTPSSYALITEVSRVLMQEAGEVPVDERAKVRADIVDLQPVMRVEEPTEIVIEVTNLGQVIRAFEVSLLGIDPKYVTIDTPTVELFPWERQTVTAIVRLPTEQPAGRQRLAVQVIEAGDDAPPPAIAEFSVEVEGRPAMTLVAEPATLEIGGSGVFIVHLLNTGNTELAVDLAAQDDERLVTVLFEPARPELQPGERSVVTARAKGPRPWFGTPAVRVLHVEATSQGISAVSALAILQRPRIGRRLVSLLGLLLVITLFAYVIALSFGRVAELTEQNQALVQQGLGFEDQSGVRVDPSTVSGQVRSSTGAGIDGATVRLFDQGNVIQPMHTTVTDESGAYAFGAVADGTYLLQTEAAGFGVTWFDGSATIDGATPIVVADQQVLEGLDLNLTGRPGSVEGLVVGSDVAGALVSVRLPAASVAGSDLAPVAAVVAAVEIDVTGVFVLPDLATPATYELAVSKVGFATEIRTITLKAGEQRQSLEILLRPGIGLIGGQVQDTSGEPVGGVDIRATDGTSESSTRSLSGDADSGGFVLRNLPTPGTYTLTLTAPGFFTETVTIALEAEQQRSDQVIVMTRDAGVLRGHVRTAAGAFLGGASVTVVGTDVERTTQSLTVDDLGSWSVDALPVPGTYTVRFTSPGWTTTALTVQLLPGPEAIRGGVDAVLTQAKARVEGFVTDTDGKRIGGVEITLDASGLQRSTRTSDVPLGKYVFDNVPAGAYTLTFRRAGSTPQTLLVDLAAGQTLEVADVELEAQARIEGVVTRNGVATSDIGVLVYRERDYPEGLVASTVTSADGRFELVGLDAPEGYVIDFQVPAGGQVVESRTVFLQPNETRKMQVDL